MTPCFPLVMGYGIPDMKQIIFSALAVAFTFAFISCERHAWEDSAEGAKDGTKNLYPTKEKKDHDDH